MSTPGSCSADDTAADAVVQSATVQGARRIVSFFTAAAADAINGGCVVIFTTPAGGAAFSAAAGPSAAAGSSVAAAAVSLTGFKRWPEVKGSAAAGVTEQAANPALPDRNVATVSRDETCRVHYRLFHATLTVR
jgi:hypothetical protein